MPGLLYLGANLIRLMRMFFLLILGSLVVFSSAFITQQKKKIIFFGDSITQAGVNPNGYVTRIAELIAKEGLKSNYELVGAGIGGNKIYDLFLRMEEDVISRKPDIVVIYVGVNDVWHKTSHGTGTDADKFEKFYNAVINRLTSNGIRVVLVTPAVIGERTDFSNAQDGDLNHYSNIIRTIAVQRKLPLVDLRDAFLSYNKQNNPDNKESGILTTDRVHLNDKGNQLVAEEMWRVLKGK
jgi:isoamyl acetate esterase